MFTSSGRDQIHLLRSLIKHRFIQHCSSLIVQILKCTTLPYPKPEKKISIQIHNITYFENPFYEIDHHLSKEKLLFHIC